MSGDPVAGESPRAKDAEVPPADNHGRLRAETAEAPFFRVVTFCFVA